MENTTNSLQLHTGKSSGELLGVIGGLGPMATAYFLQLLTEMTDASCDQEHLEILIHSDPKIPDRTSYIIGNSSESPLEPMARVGCGLKESGASVIAIPCITAHYFHEELEKMIGIPVIHGIRETASYLKEQGVSCAGIMATDGTIQSGIFASELKAQGIEAVVPTKEGQGYVMDLIYKDVKAGVPLEMDKFRRVSQELHQAGAQVILLGCTELSMVKRDYPLGKGYLDVMEVLARASVLKCGKLKESYRRLITE